MWGCLTLFYCCTVTLHLQMSSPLAEVSEREVLQKGSLTFLDKGSLTWSDKTSAGASLLRRPLQSLVQPLGAVVVTRE